jgi:hypothetical protein
MRPSRSLQRSRRAAAGSCGVSGRRRSGGRHSSATRASSPLRRRRMASMCRRISAKSSSFFAHHGGRAAQVVVEGLGALDVPVPPSATSARSTSSATASACDMSSTRSSTGAPRTPVTSVALSLQAPAPERLLAWLVRRESCSLPGIGEVARQPNGRRDGQRDGDDDDGTGRGAPMKPPRPPRTRRSGVRATIAVRRRQRAPRPGPPPRCWRA